MNLTEALFAPPIWMPGVGLSASLVLLYIANKRLDRTLRRVGLTALIAVVAWAVAGYLVVTPREAASGGTKAFVAAVVARDGAKVGSLLAANATCGSFGKADIVAVASTYADKWGLQRAFITDTALEERGTQLNCNITVFSQHDGNNAPGSLKTEWRFVWENTPDGWRIIEIDPIRVGDQDARDIVGKYFTNKP